MILCKDRADFAALVRLLSVSFRRPGEGREVDSHSKCNAWAKASAGVL
jgi:hypothetical protein